MTAENKTVVDPIALHEGEGESRWFLDMLLTFKASGATTGGRAAVVEHRAPHGSATPLHIHHSDDEWFYILEGEVTVWVDGVTTVAGPGAFVYCPMGVPHTNLISSPEGAHFLLGFAPAVADGFVIEASETAPRLELPPADREPPDPAVLDELAKKYDIEIIGPPGIPD